MSARTFTYGGVNNLWTTAGNWDTPPVDNDSVTIASGSTCTYDGDMSNAGTWPNGIAGITVTGIMNFALTGGPYYLKIKTATYIGGAGTLNIGTLANPIPFAVKHTITGGINWYISGASGLTMTVYAAEPSITTVKTINAESIGATRLEIDTNISADIWAATDTIRIDNVNKALNSEVRVISAIDATPYIDITASLTAAKIAGTVITLITRNVQIISAGTTSGTIKTFSTGKLTIAGGSFVGSAYYCLDACTGATISGGSFTTHFYVFNACPTLTITGGVYSGNSYVVVTCLTTSVSGGSYTGNIWPITACTGISISGGIYSGNTIAVNSNSGITVTGGTYTGNGNAFSSCAKAIVSGVTITNNTNGFTASVGLSFAGNTISTGTSGFTACYGLNIIGGTISGFTNAITLCGFSHVTGCTISGNTYGIISSGATFIGVTFSGNTYDICQAEVTLHNCTLASNPENYLYDNLGIDSYSESTDYNTTGGAFKAWTTGGITTSVASPVPTGYARAYDTTCVSATYPGFWQKRVVIPAGKTICFTMWIRKDASMAYKPRCWIFLDNVEPWAGGSTLKEFVFPDDDNNTWETDTYSYTNSNNYDKMLIVRFLGKNGSGDVFTALTVNPATGNFFNVL